MPCHLDKAAASQQCCYLGNNCNLGSSDQSQGISDWTANHSSPVSRTLAVEANTVILHGFYMNGSTCPSGLLSSGGLQER